METNFPLVYVRKFYPMPRDRRSLWGKVISLLLPFTNGRCDMFELVAPCRCGEAADSYVIRAGYRTDGMSSPRMLWPLFPPHGLSFEPSVRHDWAYDMKGEVAPGRHLSRAAIDRIFLNDLLAVGIPRWQAYTQWAYVRAFGSIPFYLFPRTLFHIVS